MVRVRYSDMVRVRARFRDRDMVRDGDRVRVGVWVRIIDRVLAFGSGLG
jgi:hypothetical protein